MANLQDLLNRNNFKNPLFASSDSRPLDHDTELNFGAGNKASIAFATPNFGDALVNYKAPARAQGVSMGGF